jgi:hypothetical protein
MDISISINDAVLLAGLQRALDEQNATRNVPLTHQEFVQGFVTDYCRALGSQYLKPILTKREFLERFTAEERVAIRTAAQNSMAVQDYLELVNVSDAIDLTYATTVAGVQALEAAGLIALGRAAEVLAL